MCASNAASVTPLTLSLRPRRGALDSADATHELSMSGTDDETHQRTVRDVAASNGGAGFVLTGLGGRPTTRTDHSANDTNDAVLPYRKGKHTVVTPRLGVQAITGTAELRLTVATVLDQPRRAVRPPIAASLAQLTPLHPGISNSPDHSRSDQGLPTL